MATVYLKLGHVAGDIADGDYTLAALLTGIADGSYTVVNVKGLILTAAEVSRHLSGGVDGDTLTYLDR